MLRPLRMSAGYPDSTFITGLSGITGNNMARFCSRSCPIAVSTSFYTHSPSTECFDKKSRSLSCMRSDPSMPTLTSSSVFKSSGAYRQRTLCFEGPRAVSVKVQFAGLPTHL
jgi:hypothetical protein